MHRPSSDTSRTGLGRRRLNRPAASHEPAPRRGSLTLSVCHPPVPGTERSAATGPVDGDLTLAPVAAPACRLRFMWHSACSFCAFPRKPSPVNVPWSLCMRLTVMEVTHKREVWLTREKLFCAFWMSSYLTISVHVTKVWTDVKYIFHLNSLW